MSNYRREMLELVQDLHTRAGKIRSERGQHKAEKLRRQAEVLEFIVLHPEGLPELFKSQESEAP